MKLGRVAPLVADPLHADFTNNTDTTRIGELGQNMVYLIFGKARKRQ